MMNLDELQRLAEEAADEADGDWFCPDLLGPGAPPISASTKARAFMHAFDPDTAKKLIAVAKIGRDALSSLEDVTQLLNMVLNAFGDVVPDADGMAGKAKTTIAALRTALEELK